MRFVIDLIIALNDCAVALANLVLWICMLAILLTDQQPTRGPARWAWNGFFWVCSAALVLQLILFAIWLAERFGA